MNCEKDPILTLPPEAVKLLAEIAERDQSWKDKYGEARRLVQTDHQGRKFIVVGSKLLHSARWKTVPDFLADYLRMMLGKEWFLAEYRKETDQHEIVKWYRSMVEYQQQNNNKEGDLFHGIPSGDYASLLHLSWDLFVMEDNSELQVELIRRLKMKDQFQGARYEAYVAATCIRAGFSIKYEDETDCSRKHPEFIATHKVTGVEISVEAKSRHRKGVLGKEGPRDEEPIANIRSILKKAELKASTYPHIIFIELNLPPFIFLEEVEAEVMGLLKKNYGDETVVDRFNALILTNNPYHYMGADTVNDHGYYICVESRKPANPIIFPDISYFLLESVKKYPNIPNFFDD